MLDWRWLRIPFFIILALPLTQALAQNRRQLSLELETVPGATRYEIEFTAKRNKAVYHFKSAKPAIVVNLRVGKYSLRFRTIDERGVPGPWSKPQPATVRFPVVKLLSPAAAAVLVGGTKDGQDVRFDWQEITGARLYIITIEPNHIQRIVNGPNLTIHLDNDKAYTWQVMALDDYGNAGETAKERLSFVLKSPQPLPPRPEWTAPQDDRPVLSARTLALRQSESLPAKFQLKMSLAPALWAYDSNNQDEHRQTSFSEWTALAKLALSYRDNAEDPWGFEMRGTLRLLTVQGAPNFIPGLEFLGDYRKFLGSAMLDLSPKVVVQSDLGITSYADGLETAARLLGLAPGAEGRLKVPIDTRWALFSSLGGFENELTLKTPNRQGVRPSLSWQAQAGLSMNQGTHIYNFELGYQHDTFNYKSTSPGPPALNQDSSRTGWLGVSLEFGI